jgi:hypothetical protein
MNENEHGIELLGKNTQNDDIAKSSPDSKTTTANTSPIKQEPNKEIYWG